MKILFADNDENFLDTRAEFLLREGYQIIKAYSLADAKKYLLEEWVPLAILDIRLEDDDDEKDISGIMLLKEDYTRAISKIVLTNFPDTNVIRELVLAGQSGKEITLNVIAKQDDPEILIQAVREAFSDHVKINWNLNIEWKARDTVSLVKLIEPNFEGRRLLNRAEELDNLFRCLFYEKEHIRLDRLIWYHNGRIALIVFAFNEGSKPESYLVIIGENAIVKDEVKRFKLFAPNAPGETGTMISKVAETTHFAGIAYTEVGNDLENIQTLDELYHSGNDKVFRDTLTYLYKSTLQQWHQDKPFVKKSDSLETLFGLDLKITDDPFKNIYFEERIKAFVSQLEMLDLRIVHSNDVTFTLHYNDQSFSFSNHLSAFSSLLNKKETVMATNVPGMITGENILTDGLGRAWLTDFANASQAPLFWNFVALEATIRFDWVETNNLLRRKEMEHCLINTDFLNPNLGNLEPLVSKPVRTITGIRNLAVDEIHQGIQDYHLGIFFHAVHRLANIDATLPLTVRELTRLGHIVLSIAMIAEKLEKNNVFEHPVKPRETNQLSIVDEKARIVLIGNREVQITPQPFEILWYLYKHANEVCTKEELEEGPLKGEKYEDGYVATLIGRIRRDIEDDPGHPKYIITVRNAGYRLIPNPVN